MKKLIFIFVVVVASCTIQQPISIESPKNNVEYDVSYLFEYDGCKVYRFIDHGNYVYFTNVSGDVTSFPTDSTVVVNKVREVDGFYNG